MRSRRLVVWTAVVSLLSAALAGGQDSTRPASERSAARTSPQTSAATDSSAAQPQLATPAQTGANAAASVPRLIRFSGILQNLAGRAISGPVDVTFSLYAEQAGGSALWFETQTVQADSLGRYSALLGAMSPAGVPIELFTDSQARWLGVMVQGLPEQSRVLLVSVPYALKAGDAETLGGRPAADYQLTPDSTASTDSVAKQGTTTTRGGAKEATGKTGSPTPQTLTATQNYIPVMTANDGSLGNSVMYQSGGFIGIGTKAPAFPLDLNSNVFAIGPKASLPGAGGTMRFRDDTGTVRWLFGIPGSAGSQDFFVYNNANGHAPLYIQGGAASYSIYMNANGNVGVGTTTPAAKLEVNGATKFDGLATFAAGQAVTGNMNVNGAFVVDNAGTNNGAVNPGLTFGTASEEGIASKRTPGGNQFGLDFYTGNLNRMAITRAGLVGIGTTTPQYALDVVGNIRAFTDMNVDGLGVNGGTLSSGLTFGAGSGEGIASKRTAGGNQYGLDFYTEFADRMSIRQSGQVGIGTTNPYTSLHIRGDVAGGLGPTLLLMNGGAGANAGASIDWDGYDPGSSNLPSARIQSYDDGNFSSHLTFQTKVPGAATNSLVEQVRISSHGSLIVDSSAENTGTLSDAASGGTGLVFGGTGSGEGLASCRSGTNCPPAGYSFTAPNLDGLDFFTNYHARMSIANNGDIYLSGCAWWANGNNQGNCPSDARLKTNIQSLSPVLDQLARLRPVHFNYRTVEYPQYHFPNVRMTGLIAQEVEKVFPELVSTDAHGFRTLDSGPLKFMLLEGVRELKTRNDSLRAQVQIEQAHITREDALLHNLSRSNAAKDAQLRKLTSQVQQLQKTQIEMAALEARLARLEAKTGTTSRGEQAQVPRAPKTRKSAPRAVAQVRF